MVNKTLLQQDRMEDGGFVSNSPESGRCMSEKPWVVEASYRRKEVGMGLNSNPEVCATE